MPCAIPKSGAMTSARHVAPLRKADGPSRFRMRLWMTEEIKKTTQNHSLTNVQISYSPCKHGEYSPFSPLLLTLHFRQVILPCTVDDAPVWIFSFALLQCLKASLYDWGEIKLSEFSFHLIIAIETTYKSVSFPGSHQHHFFFVLPNLITCQFPPIKRQLPSGDANG